MNAMRTIKVAGREIVIPEKTTTSQIITATGQNGRDRDLVLLEANGSKKVIPTGAITVKDGETFDTQPQTIDA